MLDWLSENWGSIIALAVVILLVVLALRSIIKDKKSGKSLCGGNCGACGACKACSKAGNCKGCGKNPE